MIVPGYGFFATVSPLLHLGAKPVFCDVRDATGNLDPQRAERLITGATRGVVVTHVAGHPAEMDALVGLCSRYGLTLIEDCSHAHGALYHGRKVGTLGHAAAFSCQAGKMLCAGEGGVLLTDDGDVLFRAAMFANFRRLEGTTFATPSALADTGIGLKLRMSPLSAALADHHLHRLDELIEQRRSSLDYLTHGLAQVSGGLLRLPVTAPNVSRGAFYEYPLRYESSPGVPLEALTTALRMENVAITRSNTRAVYRLPIFKLGLRAQLAQVWGVAVEPPAPTGAAEWLPVSDRLDAEVFTLPSFTGAPSSVLDEYIGAFGKVLAQLDDVADAWRRNASEHAQRWRADHVSQS